MPILKNTRREAFTQQKYQGLSNGEAYAKAYNRSKVSQYEYSAGERLMRNDDVQSRLLELQDGSAARADVTVDSISEMLIATHAKAVESGDLTNERQCAMNLAKLHGLVVVPSKTEKDSVIWLTGSAPMSQKQWDKEFGDGPPIQI